MTMWSIKKEKKKEMLYQPSSSSLVAIDHFNFVYYRKFTVHHLNLIKWQVILLIQAKWSKYTSKQVYIHQDNARN